MNYDISVIKTVQTFDLENGGSGILETNHIYLQNENYYNVKSKNKLFKNIDGRK